jgi:hypothetical protein
MTRPSPQLRPSTAIAAVCVATLVTACGTVSTDILRQPADLVKSGVAALGKVELPKMELPKVAVPEPDPDPVGAPLDLYTRIARGAKVCWFGGDGPLKASHIFNASAEPEAKGATAEIVIHERDPRAPDPRGNRAFVVSITPEADRGKVDIENVRFPPDVGMRMEREVRRWARDDLTCGSDAATSAAGPATATSTPVAVGAPAATTTHDVKTAPATKAALAAKGSPSLAKSAGPPAGSITVTPGRAPATTTAPAAPPTPEPPQITTPLPTVPD